MISKKDIPLELFKLIEPIIQKNLDIIKIKEEENTYYSIVETDPKSTNFFKIYIDYKKVIQPPYKASSGYLVEWKPYTVTSVKSNQIQYTNAGVITQLNQWISVIRQYESMLSVHDDNFAKTYEKYFYDAFEIVDGDANFAPFTPDKQELIESYLLDAQKIVYSLPENVSDDIKKDLVTEIADISDSLNTSTKSKIIKRIAKLYSRVLQLSKQAGKTLFSEFGKQFAKKVIEIGIDSIEKLT